MKLKKLIPNPIKIGGVVYADDIIEVGKLDELSTLKLNNLIANGSVEVVEDESKNDNQDNKTDRKELVELANEMGIEFPKNIKTEALQELIEKNQQN